MEKRELGASGLYITPIGFGAWGIGGPPFWRAHDEKISVSAIRKALDMGVNFVDTAPVYGFGLSEKIVGEALVGRRGDVVLATKCGLRWKSEKLSGLYNDLRPESVREELEDSLRRLNTEVIDLYQVHWPDPDTPIESTMETLVSLMDEGKIRAIGVSNFDGALLEAAVGAAPVASLQSKYNALERETEKELAPLANRLGLGLLAYSPLASGVLTGKYDSSSQFGDWRGKRNFGIFRKGTLEPAMIKTAELKKFAKEQGFKLSHLALRWVTSRPAVTCAIAGCNTPEQVEDNIKAAQLEIPDAVIKAFDRIAAG